MKTKFMVILLEYPAEVSQARVKEYAQAALTLYGGQYFPGDDESPPDPLFPSVRLRAAKKHMKCTGDMLPTQVVWEY